MGTVVCCKRSTEDEKKLEKRLMYSSINKPKEYKNLDIVVLSEQPTSVKNNFNNEYNNQNNEINEVESIKIEKIKKIQQKYRSYHLKNKFQTQIKPKITKKTTNFIEKFYHQCDQGGYIPPDDDFDPDKWKEYYPNDDEFFLYEKGEVFPNQVRITNVDEPDNLEIYEGEMNLQNLKHGFGILTTPHYRLKGSWRNDDFTGWGRKSLRNGDIFEGKFIKGELNGKGIFKNEDNNIYEGDFENSMRNGKGELTTDKYHYIGDFKNGELNGNGAIDFLYEGHRYEGSFENNEINGKGIYKWKNGDIYEGYMKNGKMDGYGKYTYENGEIYEGEYIDGIKQGRGKFISSNNKIYEGLFENGVPNGEGFYTENGHTYKVLYSHGKFLKKIA